jgi:hypothetical protein
MSTRERVRVSGFLIALLFSMAAWAAVIVTILALYGDP